jgi:predicted Rossmann-fold nucleotide-binding protein
VTSPVREVASTDDLREALGPAPADGSALILIGGADATEPERLDELRAFLATVARHCERTGTSVVDGGTDSGVMRLVGEARAAIGGTFPLIGVGPPGGIGRPPKDGAPLRPGGL